MSERNVTNSPAEEATESLRELIQEYGDSLPLDVACLAISQAEQNRYTGRDTLRRIDALAAALDAGFPHQGSTISKFVAIGEFLFSKENYRGNNEDYYNLRNSFLDDVVDRRRGIPITLSVLAIEVARRVGFGLRGVGFPGHFLVTTAEPSNLYLDGFRGGQILGRDECGELLASLSGGALEMKASHLEPVNSRQIVARVLQNIKGIHLRQGQLEAAVETVNRLLMLFPKAAGLLRERGLIYFQLGAFRFAAKDLRDYLAQAQDPPDVEAIEAALARAERKSQMLV